MAVYSYCAFFCVDFGYVYLSDIYHYAPINVKPYPTQYGDGWGLTKGFEVKFSPQGGAFELIKLLYHTCDIAMAFTLLVIRTIRPRGVSRLTGDLTINFSPRVAWEFDLIKGQIPNLFPPCLYWGE